MKTIKAIFMDKKKTNKKSDSRYSFKSKNSFKITSLFFGTALIFLVLLLAVLPAGYALKLYDLDSFENNTMQGIKLGEGEGAQFNLLGGRHMVLVDSIDTETNSTNLEIFISSKKVMKLTFRKGVKIRMDIDRDGVTDVVVHVFDIVKDPEKRVVLIFEDTNLGESKVTGSAVEIQKGEVIKKSPTKTLALIAMLVIALLLFLYMRKTSSGKGETSDRSNASNPSDAKKEKIGSGNDENGFSRGNGSNDGKEIDGGDEGREIGSTKNRERGDEAVSPESVAVRDTS